MPHISLQGKASQDTQNYSITDNPVFKIKTRSLETPLEQGAKGENKNFDNQKDVYIPYVGDYVQFKYKDEQLKGKITKVNKQNRTATVLDEKSHKKFLVDFSNLKSLENASTPSYTNVNIVPENKEHVYLNIKSYKNFMNNNI